METHESSRYVELLLKEELVAVAEGLEQGIYCWEEMDLPDSNGCTPLIIACRMGLTTVMHFLLESGADATLCNHSNQTALHVSQPKLQDELLLALNRDLPQQMQLSDAAWRGDLSSLQDLMAQTDMVDLNKQNRDGLTPLMLAVRDVDLFERLRLPWKYQPVEVVKELLSLSVDTKILDKRSHTALWYVSQITSSKKEELLRILNSAMQDETTFTCLECCWPGSPAVSPSSSPTRDSCTPGIKGESTKAVIAQNNLTDIYQDNRIGIDGFMEPKINMGKDSKDEGKRSSLTSSLPSLWYSRKTWDKTRPLHPSLKETFSIPVCPAPQFTQLSKSTPALMEPLLHASMLLQARANIYNRLRGGDTEDDVITQKISLPTSLRTPKHLAPLDRRYRNVTCLASLEHPLPSKPTSTLPFSSESRHKVERISMQSFRRSRSTRAGSEESNSYSSSSQEEEENVPQETDTIFDVLEKSLNLELGSNLDFQQLISSVIINNTENTNITISDDRKEDTPIRSPIVRDSKNEMILDLNSDGSSFIADENYLTTVNISVDQILHKKSKPIKMIKRNDRKGKTSFHTNQSFNILARRNQTTTSITKNGKKSPIHSKVKLRESKSTSLGIVAETPYQTHLPTVTPTISCKKTTDDILITKRVSEPYQHTRLSVNDKKVSNNIPNQFPRDLRSAGLPKKPALGVPLRAKSAVEHVTYNDMFLKISQGDEGPEIYEMFATPMYENLRADNSSEQTKPVNTSLQVERQINRKRDQKTMEVNRRKQAQSERYIRTKCKQNKRRDNVPKLSKKHIPSSGNKCHIVTSDCEEEEKQNSKMPFTGDDGKEISSSVIKRQNGSMLSIIEEVLSNTVSKTDILQQHTSASTSESHLIKHTNHQEAQTPADSCSTGNPELSSVTKLPAHPLINTWTSDSTVSPVYQSFLDEVGNEPLTDDLLRSLAEGLISLEKRDDETPETEFDDGKEFSNNLPSKFKKLLNEGISSSEVHYTKRSCLDDAAITWTKGEVLGKGAYGTVYCGLTSQGQLIAVKQVVLDASTSEIAEKEYDRLEREVDLLKNLRHSNIVGFLGTGLCENIVSIFMEYVPGGSISSILSQFGPLPEKVFALYTRQILEGVAYLHANRVIHRDLKGNNIMLMPTGVVKLIDFGCARRITCLTLSKSDLLKSVHGTPYWMAPEVINETGHGRKSDIWSIGCTVFEMATGKPPLAHMAKMAALFYIGARKGLMPCLSDDFSTNAKGFVQACLTRDPSQRPSAEELLRHQFVSHHSQICKKPLN
nr:probable serine/threonine-protein kinase mkcC [Misgurnus anguillicaudatus]XP_055071609.1 probable serine/threonine-protein kinase mkcC [Misgurnus anguillicaudatus]